MCLEDSGAGKVELCYVKPQVISFEFAPHSKLRLMLQVIIHFTKGACELQLIGVLNIKTSNQTVC